MSFYNRSFYGAWLEIFDFSLYDEDFRSNGIFPPPGSDFMITETGIFMLTEDGGSLMVTES